MKKSAHSVMKTVLNSDKENIQCVKINYIWMWYLYTLHKAEGKGSKSVGWKNLVM